MTKINIQEMMTETGVLFGTSGVRGLVSQMTDQVCMAYCLAFLNSLNLAKSGQRVAIGMDLRPSSPAIVAACAIAIEQAGCIVDFCGVLPTPALAFYALINELPAIMITGSHIPFDRNGIKFYKPAGEISKSDELAITQATIELSEFNKSDVLPEINPLALESYKQRYLELFDSELLADWRIGVYEHSSAARDCIKQILTSLGADVLSLERTETFVPIDTEAVSKEDREKGIKWAAEHQLDAIISTDGDGDRPLIADETGGWLRGDIVGLLSAKFLGAQTIVTPISCNTAIEKSGLFKQVIRTKIGSPYVIAGMEEAINNNAVGIAGFEANGGFLAGKDLFVGVNNLAALPTRDAVLPVLAILAMASQQGIKVSTLVADLPDRYTASDRIQNFPVSDSKVLLEKLQNDSNAQLELWGVQYGSVTEIDLLDGLRLYFTQGEIIHLRPSGNAPELRCYAEADSMERAMEIVELTLQRIKKMQLQ